jgi:hypothetical protein
MKNLLNLSAATFLLSGLIAIHPTTHAADSSDDPTATLEAKAQALFGKQPGQRFDGRVASLQASAPRTESRTVTIAPGKGVEVKASMLAGQTIVFSWTASADVVVDMHGERPEEHDQFTSYDVSDAQKQGSGSLAAPFDGSHGWYWANKGTQPVTIQLTVTGFFSKLTKPGKS